ncbi:hypothetical protein CHU32_13260 [Superficieibacter electus]|uniref:DUF4253 domain-containing protein n=2 Tax=Superficieibacter electus TaxID=2022662 RepID=A0A2P5GNU4_9ENTR|nr:hypothetical protein CHU33_10335 [Superficieibacter electus]POP48243.1 hypothetical protein CHU32_13260 [Superficieibacter electus]
MTEECQQIIDLLHCEYQLFIDETDDKRLLATWQQWREEGEKAGFIPLIIVPDSTLTDMLEEFDPTSFAEDRRQMICEAEKLDAQALFARYPSGDGMTGEFTDTMPNDQFCSWWHDEEQLCKEILLVKIPTRNPWELAAWVPMGGFNSCPSPAEQIAVFRWWYEQYGAIPVAVTHDVWEMSVSRPPQSDEDAEKLANEQFAFCEDIVTQGMESIRALASMLKNAPVWYFWWD